MYQRPVYSIFKNIISNYIKFHPGGDIQILYKAYNLAHACHLGQYRKDRSPYFSHPLEVARILSSLGLDNFTIAAALLHDSIEDISPGDREELRKTIREDFGNEVYNLIEGVTKKEKLPEITKDERKEISLQKMIMHSSKDMRVLLIKIADRIHNMNTLGNMKPYKQKEIAVDTLRVYIPLTKILGMYSFARDLEDRCLYYLNYDVYDQLDKLIDKYSPIIEKRYEDFERIMENALKKNSIRYLKLEKRKRNLFDVLKKFLQKDKMEDIDFEAVSLEASRLEDIVKELNIIITVSRKLQIGQLIGVINSHFLCLHNNPSSFWNNEIYDRFIQVNDAYGIVNIGIRCEEENSLRLKEIKSKLHFVSVEKPMPAEDILSSFKSVAKLMDEVDALRPGNDFYKIFEDMITSPKILVFYKDENMLIPAGSKVLDMLVVVSDPIIKDCIPCVQVFINGNKADLLSELHNNDNVMVWGLGGVQLINGTWIEKCELMITKDFVSEELKKQEALKSVENGRNNLLTKLRMQSLDPNIIESNEFWKIVENDLGIKNYGSVYAKACNDPLFLDKVVDIAKKCSTYEDAGFVIFMARPIKKIVRSIHKKTLLLSDISDQQIILCDTCMPLVGDPICGIWESNKVHVHIRSKKGASHFPDHKELIPLKWGTFSSPMNIPATLTIRNEIGNLHKLLEHLRSNNLKTIDVKHEDKGVSSEVCISFSVSNTGELRNIHRLFKGIGFVIYYSMREISN